MGSRFCLAVVFQPAALLAAGGWSAPRPATGVGKKGSGPEAEAPAQKKGKGADGGVKLTSPLGGLFLLTSRKLVVDVCSTERRIPIIFFFQTQ